MSSGVKKEDVNELVAILGCTQKEATEALKSQKTKEAAFEYIFNKRTKATSSAEDDINKAIEASLQTAKTDGMGGSIPGISKEDEEMNVAIALSLENNNFNNASYEPLQPKDRQREAGIPVGLKNVGNT